MVLKNIEDVLVWKLRPESNNQKLIAKKSTDFVCDY